MTGTEVHDLDSMRVGDLVLAVAPATERTTLEIVVDRDATLVLKAPRSASIERVEEFVASKRSWIYRKLAEKDALVGPPIVKQFVDGEGFAYLGRSHRLLIDDAADTVRLDRGRFLAPPAVRTGGVQLMRDWYVGTGTQWLRGRVQPWAIGPASSCRRATSTTSSSTNSVISARPTTLPSSGPPSAVFYPATNRRKRTSPRSVGAYGWGMANGDVVEDARQYERHTLDWDGSA